MNMFAALTGNNQAVRSQLAPAKAALERYGYETLYAADGTLIVKDPVHGSVGGKLVLSHYQDVKVRSYDSARAFINVRS